ncbi:MAG: histidine kinase [Lachnospiraceae bacterium]|nr:histidine kinase [Lachnospiraceae bacterium]
MSDQSAENRKKPFSLRRQVLLFLCLLLLPFSILSSVLSINTLQNLQQQYTRQTQAVLDSYAAQLAHRTETADYLLLNLFTDNDLVLRFERNTGDWHHTLYRVNLDNAVRDALVLSGSADGLFLLLNSSEELVHSGRLQYGQTSSQAMPEDSLRALIKDPAYGDGKWHLAEADDTVYLIHILRDSSSRFGAYLNCTAFFSSLNLQNDPYGTVLSIDDQLPPEETGHLLTSSRIAQTPVYIISDVRSSSVYGNVISWVVASILLIAFSVLMIPLFLLVYYRKINRPLQTLQGAFHELEDGNEDYRITERASSAEFYDANLSFNSMASNLSSLQRQVLEEEQHRHELAEHNLNLQLDNLQLQIRPHFLQNTMNLLFTLIHNGQSENAERLVLYLSKYFRYMFRHGHDLELFSRELEMVQEYLEISELHYQNAFTVSYQIDPILSFMRIPPLLLHNFVENIIQHALIPGKTIHIILYGEYDDEQKMAVLQVSDDGNGISEEYADMINRNDFSSLPAGKHIGVRNSINRLHYYYGDQAGVTVDSAEGEGTTFTIRIPCNLTEDDEEDEII